MRTDARHGQPTRTGLSSCRSRRAPRARRADSALASRRVRRGRGTIRAIAGGVLRRPSSVARLRRLNSHAPGSARVPSLTPGSASIAAEAVMPFRILAAAVPGKGAYHRIGGWAATNAARVRLGRARRRAAVPYRRGGASRPRRAACLSHTAGACARRARSPASASRASTSRSARRAGSLPSGCPHDSSSASRPPLLSGRAPPPPGPRAPRRAPSGLRPCAAARGSPAAATAARAAG